MEVTLHDGFGHVAEAVDSAATSHGHAHGNAVMRHLATRSQITSMSAHDALLDALLGRDPRATELAREINDAGVVGTYDPDVIAALAKVCGGVDADVAVAIAPFLDDDCSIEGEDGSGVAWHAQRIDVQPAETGEILRSDGMVWLGMEISHTLAAGAGGRTLGEIVELPCMPAGRVVASIETGEGETLIRLAA